MNGKGWIVGLVIIVALMGIFGYLLRPMLHGPIMDLAYLCPAFFWGFWIGIAGLVVAWVCLANDKKFLGAIGIVMVLFGLCWAIPGLFANGPMTTAYMQYGIRDNLNVVETLENTSPENVRMMPYANAKRNAMNNLTYSRYKPGNLDFVVGQDGKLFWNAPLDPEGVWNVLLRKPMGAIYIDATTSEFNMQVVELEFPYSAGIGISDSIYWQAAKLDYWARYSDPYYLETEDGIVAVLSQRKYRSAFYGGFIPIRVPYFSGVYLFYPDEKVRWIPADEIDEEPLLDGQQVFPEEIARRLSQSFAYPHGIWDKTFKHRDQYELADIPSEGNIFPYFINLEDRGPTWFTALEPYGTTYGLKALLFIDARTGEISVWQKGSDETVVGPVTVLDYIKSHSQMSNVVWADFMVIEPLPIFRNGEFWWKTTMTRGNKTAITKIIFCNAMNPQEVVVTENSDEAYRFIRGESLSLVDAGVAVLDFSAAIKRIEVQITQLGNIPDELMSPLMTDQLSELYALKQFLVTAEQAAQQQPEPTQKETDQ